jgi:hypothetical protein
VPLGTDHGAYREDALRGLGEGEGVAVSGSFPSVPFHFRFLMGKQWLLLFSLLATCFSILCVTPSPPPSPPPCFSLLHPLDVCSSNLLHSLRPESKSGAWTFHNSLRQKSKPIPVTGRGGSLGCETSRFPHFLDNLLKDGGEVLSFTRRPAAFYTQEDSWYSFLLEAESPPGP